MAELQAQLSPAMTQLLLQFPSFTLIHLSPEASDQVRALRFLIFRLDLLQKVADLLCQALTFCRKLAEGPLFSRELSIFGRMKPGREKPHLCHDRLRIS